MPLSLKCSIVVHRRLNARIGMQRIVLALMLSGPFVSMAWGQLVLNGTHLTATSPELTVRFEGINIGLLTNNRTGESYIEFPGSGWFDLGMQHSSGIGLTPGPWAIRFDDSTGRQVAELTASDAERPLKLSVSTTAHGEISISISGRSLREGVRSGVWGIREFDPSKGRFLFPGQGGIYFDSASPQQRLGLEYPTHWEAQFAVFESQAAGGLLMYARDPHPYFKRVHATREFGTLDIAMESFAVAPWSSATEIPTIEWRLKAFDGSWTNAVDHYRDWSRQHVPVPSRPDPAWARDVQVVMTVANPRLTYVEELAARVTPEDTLLYLVNWRVDSYDVNLPDYTPTEATTAFVEQARAMGFRIMLHVNALGVATYHELYPSLSQYQIRDPDSGDLVYWPFGLWGGAGLPPDYIPIFAIISPAAHAYRQAWLNALRPALESLRPDALHIDAGGVMLNDANGLVEGNTTIQGMIAMMGELLQTYPDLVLSYESMTEYVRPLFGFAQRWSSTFPAHPIGTYLFGDINFYGFLGQNHPDDAGFIDYIRRYESQGVVPTLELDHIVRRTEEGAELPVTDIMLELIRLWQVHDFRPDWDSEWAENTQFQFISRDGSTTAVVEDLESNRVRLAVDGETLYERVRNTTRVESEGFIPGWNAFDASSIFGLDPEAEYWIAPAKERPNDVPYLSALGSTAKLGLGTKATGTYGYFELESVGEDEFELAAALNTLKRGVIFYGREYALTRNGVVQATPTLTGGEATDTVLLMRPPINATGAVVFGDVETPIPRGRPFLQFSTALTDFAIGSDGALFVLRIDGTEVYRQMVFPGTQSSARIDLARWAGTTTTLRFILHPGPRLNAFQDIGAWADLRITNEDDSNPRVPFSLSLPPTSVSAHVSGSVQWDGSAGPEVFEASVSLPARLAVFSVPPMRVVPGDTLLDVDFDTWSASYGGLALEAAVELTGQIRSVNSEFVTEESALATYPPGKGRTLVTWAVRLDESVSAIDVRVGLADPPPLLPQTFDYSGAQVALRINGELEWNEELRSPGWKDRTIDVSRWAGQSVVVELEVDALSSSILDWVHWAGLKFR